jgi:hypothetical protein
MLTWGEFAAAEPELASEGKALFRAFTLGHLATIDGDGAPRVDLVTVTIHDGGLYAFVVHGTPKRANLERDGRYALQSFPRFRRGTLESFVDDEFSLRGRAVPIDDPAERATVACVHNDTVHERDRLFRLDLDRAHHKTRVDGRAVYRRWHAPR